MWWYLRVNSLWVLKLGGYLYHLKIDGREQLPNTGPLILVSRHSSRIEVFRFAFLCSVFKEWHTPAAGPDIVNNRIFTWCSRELGMFPARSRSADALRNIYRFLAAGKIIVMMVDGEVPWDGRPQPLRQGAAWLALRSHAPVIAMALQGAYDIWPRWASRPHLSGKLVLKIGKPFYLADGPCQRVTSVMITEANHRLMAELDALSDTSTVQTTNALEERV